MPNTLLTFDVEDKRARAAFARLKREVDQLDREFEDTRSEAERAGQAMERLGTSSNRAGQLLDQFGRPLRKATDDLDKLGDTARDTDEELNRFGNNTRKALPPVNQLGNSAGRTTQAFGLLTGSLGSAKALLGGLGIVVAGREMLEFGRNAARASIQIDSYTRALEVLEGSALIAENRIRRLQDLADQPGLRFRDAVEGALALKAVRIEGELTTRVLTELGNAAAFTGGQGEFQRGLLGLRQIAARGRISQEELNQLTENISIASTVLRNEFGTVLAEDIQKILDETGQSTTDFIETLISGFEKLERFPIDAPSVKLKNLSNSFFEFQAALGDTFLPTIAAGAQGLTALFDTLTNGIKTVNDFFDIVDEEHRALLDASESAREFSIRLTDINTAAGQRKAVQERIQHLYRLRSALRTEQAALDDSTQGYFDYAKQIRDVNNELDTLRNIQGTAERDTRAQIIAVRTEELQRVNAEIQRYTGMLARIRTVATSEAHPAVQQLVRSLERNRQEAAGLQREIQLLTNGFQDLKPPVETATADLTNYGLALARLKAEAEDAQATLRNTPIFSAELTPNFQAAINASNAYYNERIRQAETALAAEERGTEAFNTREAQIFQLRRQRKQAEDAIEAARSRIAIERGRVQQKAEEDALRSTSAAFREYRQILNDVQDIQQAPAFRAYIDRLQQQGLTFQQIVPHAAEYLEFLKEIAAIPAAASPDAQFGRLRSEIEATTEKGNALLNVMREIFQTQIVEPQRRRDEADLARALDARIPDPAQRQRQIDDRIAEEGLRGQPIDPEAYTRARRFYQQFLSDQNRDQNRETLLALREQERYYRQFANTVSSLFTGIVTGRIQGFEDVARQFIAQSLRIIARAFVEYQIQKRLDDQLTAAKIANQQKVAAAQQAGVGIGNLPGLANLPGLSNLGGFLSGGAGALGVAGLLFPNESSNLLSGIKNEISGLLSNVAAAPDRAFGAQQVFLKIGENETREITDLQDELREENRV